MATALKKTKNQKAKPQKTVKSAKSAPKASVNVKAKAPVKSAKPVSKIVSKTPAKTALKKPVAKTVVKKPVKAAPAKVAPKAAKVIAKPVKSVIAKPQTKISAKPIAVAKAVNENMVTAKDVKSAPKAAVVLEKTSHGLKPHLKSAPVGFDLGNRPAYRPIQVTNKSLAPVQPVRQMAPVPANEKAEFKKGDYVVYPAHGVGEIEAIEIQTIGGMEIKLYAIMFEKDRMRLKVPVFKAHASGLRRLSNTNRMQDALKTLQGRAQVRRAMWSRRAQEYETKINSGDPVAIAEVLRDLKRSNDESEQSYSERQIYQSAMERLAREVAAVEKITEIEATDRLEKIIRGGRKAKEEKTAIAA